MTLIAFPSSRFTRADRAELTRWDAALPEWMGWRVWTDPNNGETVAVIDDRTQFASIAWGDATAAAVYHVQPERGRWHLIDARRDVTVATFPTLRQTLEAVYPTLTATASAARETAAGKP